MDTRNKRERRNPMTNELTSKVVAVLRMFQQKNSCSGNCASCLSCGHAPMYKCNAYIKVMTR